MAKPIDHFAEALAAVEEMVRQRIIDGYAVGGAMAHSFWAEPTATFDLDVFVLLPSTLLTSLEPIYRWARQRGYAEEAEHIIISDVPVQLIPAHNELAEEAVKKAADLDYGGQPVRVIRPEYLIALALEGSARTRKRLARVALLLEEAEVDRELLKTLLDRYKLSLPTTL